MKNLAIKISLFLNYFVFAILLNSVGTVILQSKRNFGLDDGAVSVLEAFKDLPIAISSFLVAMLLTRIGIKRSMLISLGLVTIICAITPLVATEFWFFKLMFVVIGISFAIIKIGVYSTIGLVTDGEKEHASLMGYLEGFFMVGVLLGNVLFSLFIVNDNDADLSWHMVYVIVAVLTGLAFILLLFSHLDESEAISEDTNLMGELSAMARLLIRPLLIVFLASAFLFVLVEQSFQTWMPTFFKDMLQLPATMSVQAGAVLAGAFAFGRIFGGFLLRYVNWLVFLLICLGLLALSIFIVVPMAQDLSITNDITWFNAPLAVYLVPLMGMFLAPVYPTINSTILSSLPKHLHSLTAGLIVVFSALGGTMGSFITGQIFNSFDGFTAFKMAIIPISLLALCLFLLNLIKNKEDAKAI